MVLPNIKQSLRSGPDMSCAVSLAQTLQRMELANVPTIARAQQSIARKLQVGVSTFENLVRGRVKRVDAAIRDRLQALLVRELEQEIHRLSHELQMARQIGVGLADDQVSAIQAHLASARTLLEEGVRGPCKQPSDMPVKSETV